MMISVRTTSEKHSLNLPKRQLMDNIKLFLLLKTDYEHNDKKKYKKK
jgi:hypothetical protein